MKNYILVAVAASLTSPVLAGPYVNVETNASFSGPSYKSRSTDLHIGYEGQIKKGSYYLQGGRTFNSADGADTTSNWTGKGGLSVPFTEKLTIYGELSFAQVEDDDNNFGTKLGTKITF